MLILMKINEVVYFFISHDVVMAPISNLKNDENSRKNSAGENDTQVNDTWLSAHFLVIYRVLFIVKFPKENCQDIS